jgi:hypothetical protein
MVKAMNNDQSLKILIYQSTECPQIRFSFRNDLENIRKIIRLFILQ